jgi:hypothetical protein
MDGKGAIVCNGEGRRFMGGQKPEKVKKHICTGLLAHAHDGSTKGRSGHDKKIKLSKVNSIVRLCGGFYSCMSGV